MFNHYAYANLLSAAQFDSPDSTYRITNSIDMQGGTLNLPMNCSLNFDGGKIINGTIVFNGTKLINPCFENCRFKGSVADSYFNVRDFGIFSSNEKDCSDIINDIIKLKTHPSSSNNPKFVYLPKGTYYIDNPIELFAGFESPVTLFGDGNVTSICQRNNNEYILKVFEQNHVKNLKLTYKNKQTLKDKKAIAVACQRSIYSIFDNLTICKANTAFGYITLYDQKHGYNPTGYQDQCYVSDNFRNIRVYEATGYAFDFKKEFPQGDSGSAYDNIYISNAGWLGGRNNDATMGAIRADNTMASFTQLNIEGSFYSSPLIDLGGFSRISIQTLHIEGLKDMPTIAQSSVQSMLHMDLVDIQFCKLLSKDFSLFVVRDNAIIDVSGLCIRPDCSIDNALKPYMKSTKSKYSSITVRNIIDGTNTQWN